MLMKKERSLIPMAKIKGREDNYIYNVNEGYNLKGSDGTFFEEFRLREIFSNDTTAKSEQNSAITS